MKYVAAVAFAFLTASLTPGTPFRFGDSLRTRCQERSLRLTIAGGGHSGLRVEIAIFINELDRKDYQSAKPAKGLYRRFDAERMTRQAVSAPTLACPDGQSRGLSRTANRLRRHRTAFVGEKTLCGSCPTVFSGDRAFILLHSWRIIPGASRASTPVYRFRSSDAAELKRGFDRAALNRFGIIKSLQVTGFSIRYQATLNPWRSTSRLGVEVS